MTMWNCEFCIYMERRGIPSRWESFKHYAAHMLDYHGIIVKPDGLGTVLAQPPPPESDEL